MASKNKSVIADLSEIDMPDTTVSVRDMFDLDIDMDELRWQNYGIIGLEPTSADFATYGEVNDIVNYLDRPRELNFSIRLKW